MCALKSCTLEAIVAQAQDFKCHEYVTGASMACSSADGMWGGGGHGRSKLIVKNQLCLRT